MYCGNLDRILCSIKDRKIKDRIPRILFKDDNRLAVGFYTILLRQLVSDQLINDDVATRLYVV
jgi:hypothetical protein